MIHAQQPGSQPIDVPEVIPNPAVPQPAPVPSPGPKEPLKAPAQSLACPRFFAARASACATPGLPGGCAARNLSRLAHDFEAGQHYQATPEEAGSERAF